MNLGVYHILFCHTAGMQMLSPCEGGDRVLAFGCLKGPFVEVFHVLETRSFETSTLAPHSNPFAKARFPLPTFFVFIFSLPHSLPPFSSSLRLSVSLDLPQHTRLDIPLHAIQTGNRAPGKKFHFVKEPLKGFGTSSVDPSGSFKVRHKWATTMMISHDFGCSSQNSDCGSAFASVCKGGL